MPELFYMNGLNKPILLCRYTSYIKHRTSNHFMLFLSACTESKCICKAGMVFFA